ncbi:unnamed protein product, partial [Iphiclides podalirius]
MPSELSPSQPVMKPANTSQVILVTVKTGRSAIGSGSFSTGPGQKAANESVPGRGRRLIPALCLARPLPHLSRCGGRRSAAATTMARSLRKCSGIESNPAVGRTSQGSDYASMWVPLGGATRGGKSHVQTSP